MGERIDVDEVDDIMLPGFRFHPTDEELVGYYLRRKIQRLPLPLELIRQLDIYKFDPWDLPKFAASGEREWYFYCPRDRKYRNSTRPNRVTVAGFWKATGTDKPIYSSDGARCIGLKKSLVFYIGRAAKGLKTDWMMHEFRLPSLPDSIYSMKVAEKTRLPNQDSLAICRIFKKTNSQRQGASAASPHHSWFSSLPDAIASNELHRSAHQLQFRTENFSLISNLSSFSAMDVSSFENLNLLQSKTTRSSSCVGGVSDGFAFAPMEASHASKCTVDTTSMLANRCLLDYEGPPQHQDANGFSASFPEKVGGALDAGEDDEGFKVKDQWEAEESVGFPVSLQSNDAWKPSTFPFDLTKFLVEMSASNSLNIFSPRSLPNRGFSALKNMDSVGIDVEDGGFM